MSESVCSIEGCGRKFYAKTWCQMHHARWRRNGDPKYARPKGVKRRVTRYQVESAARKALAVLRAHQWEPIGHSGIMMCVECKGDGEERMEHTPDCALAEAISDLEAVL